MNNEHQRQGQGAPLRVFFLVIAFWILGRLLWESNSPTHTTAQNLAANVTTGPSIASAQREIRPERTFFDNRRQAEVPLAQSSSMNLTAITRLGYFGVNPASKSKELKSHERDSFFIDPFQHRERFSLMEQGALIPSKPEKQSDPLLSYGRTNEKDETHRSVKQKRWSGYFWVFARQGSSGFDSGSTIALPQSGASQYGGSQAGAILAYRISGTERRGLSVFSRASSPLAVRGEEEFAIGSFVRPVKGLPIAIYAEQRFGHTDRLNRGTAIYIAGGTGPDQLIERVSLETYGQVGYLRNKQGTYFFDGSANMQTELLERDRKRLTIGGGVWAGGQENVSRLDIGPRVNLQLPIGDLATRVSVDWRHRIAGNARPDSGLAVSISTGF